MPRQEFQHYLDQIGQSLRIGRPKREDIRAELEDHIETHLQALLAEGLSYEEAVSQIMGDLGDAGIMAQQFGRIGQGRKWIMRSMLAASVVVFATLATSFLMPPQPGNPFAPTRISAVAPTDDARTSSRSQATGHVPTSLRIDQFSDPDNEAIRRVLEERIDVDYQDKRFSEALKSIRDKAGVNLMANWASLEAAAIEQDISVTLKLHNAKISTVLTAVLGIAGSGEVELSYAIRDGLLVVATLDDLSRQVEIRLYDCADLIEAKLSEGRRMELENTIYHALGSTTGRTDSKDLAERILKWIEKLAYIHRDEELIETIKSTVAPESWMDNGGNIGGISVFGHTFVIAQTPKNHKAIEALLQGLSQMEVRTAAAR